MDSTKKDNVGHNVRKYLREYNEVTGIHGLRYLTEKRTKGEKIVWAIIVLVSLAGCIYMIYEILKKYENCPVVVSFATEDTPIYEIPFPAVTICPETKCSTQKFNFTDIYFKIRRGVESLNETQLLYYNYLNMLCDGDEESVEDIAKSNKTVGNNFFEIIHKLAPKVQMDSDFMGVSYELNEIFTPIIIDQGICFSFNILDRSHIFREHVALYSDFYQVSNFSNDFDIESGFKEEANVDTYPRRALMSGADNSLDIYMEYNNNDTDYICNAFLQGFRILIHNPWDVPRLSKDYFRVPLDKTVVAAVYPQLVTTSEAVRNFHHEKRKCYLTNERLLQHFKMYTESNCLLECLTNYTLIKCGCVNYFMPRDNSTAICGSGSIDCMEGAENELKMKDLTTKLSGKTYCDCKPSCNSLNFGVETSHSDFYWREYFTVRKRHGMNVTQFGDEIHWSVLSIYFKTEQFIRLERNELYGVSDLISNFGGLLGLFTGFSLISLAEIIYFLSLRIWCNRRLYGVWSGPPS